MTSLRLIQLSSVCHHRATLVLAMFFGAITIATPATAIQSQDDSPRELAGISASASFNTIDDLPLDLQDKTAISMLYRLRKASPVTLDRFAAFSKDVSLTQARDETIDFRFWLFRFSANLTKIQKVPITDAPSTSDSIGHLYRCTALATDSAGISIPCTILTRSIPSQLPLETEIDTPIQVTGLLYCRALVSTSVEAGPTGRPTDANQPTLVFIADRLAWFPKTESVADKQMVALASTGFDVAQLDRIKSCNGKALGTKDADAFYQMLTTVGATSDLPPAVPIKSVIAKSTENIGARVELTARCRACTRVEVSDPDKRERYSIDHFYQMFVFPDLDQAIVLSENTPDGPAKAVYKRFPVTICATQLPAGLSPEDVTGNPIAIDGTFFRIWKYDAEINQQANTSATISPLIITRDIEVIESALWMNHIVTWGFGGIAALVAFMYAYHRVFSKKQTRPAESILDSLPEKIDATGLE